MKSYLKLPETEKRFKNDSTWMKDVAIRRSELHKPSHKRTSSREAKKEEGSTLKFRMVRRDGQLIYGGQQGAPQTSLWVDIYVSMIF